MGDGWRSVVALTPAADIVPLAIQQPFDAAIDRATVWVELSECPQSEASRPRTRISLTEGAPTAVVVLIREYPLICASRVRCTFREVEVASTESSCYPAGCLHNWPSETC